MDYVGQEYTITSKDQTSETGIYIILVVHQKCISAFKFKNVTKQLLDDLSMKIPNVLLKTVNRKIKQYNGQRQWDNAMNSC